MKKVFYSLPVMIALCFVFSLSAFAATGLKDYVFVSCNGGIYDANGNFVEKNIGFFDNSANEPNTTLIRILHPGGGVETFTGFRLALIAAGYIKVESGHYFQYTLKIDETVYMMQQNPDLKAYVLTSEQTVYELNVSYTRDTLGSANTNVVITVGGLVGDGEPIQFGTLFLDFKGIGSSLNGTMAYTLVCSNTLSVVPTADQVRHEELLQEIQNVTDQVINEDFGYTPPEGSEEVPGLLEQLRSNVASINDYWNTFVSDLDEFKEVVFSNDNTAYSFLWCWFKMDGYIYVSILSCLFFLIMRKIVL